eukprot:CAMPEP_0178839744 /NCGR_PEP_ID=MMETSP0746-20121128/14038_1 /TAXON_ID=913974 /ORGANISM="Nitzschia punctata, Strain CCMP561" /LENGTH=136 /DNA_ID=CAMNT_0020502835 /DNA_START=97 /DNA_END=508 /DNA_ORIENTATION=+
MSFISTLDNKPIPEFRANDLRHATIQKNNVDTPNGLVVERRGKGEYYIKEVGGMFEKLHKDRIRPGDRIVKLNGKPIEEFPSLWDVNNFLKKELKITVHVKRDGLHLEPKQEWSKPEYTANASAAAAAAAAAAAKR